MDRNPSGSRRGEKDQRSLSARRAWIEISHVLPMIVTSRVALRKESVDRNDTSMPPTFIFSASLSARRAWIEIKVRYPWTPLTSSLSARRAWIEIPPHVHNHTRRRSLSARRAWIEMPGDYCKCSNNAGRSPQGERG